MRVLGIESSCDETGVAIYDGVHGLMAHVLHSQVDMHAKHGGVVPELASRDHINRLIPLINDAFINANCTKHDIDLIAYTAGPGLIGALLVGASFAKSMALGLGIPALAVHHLEAHILAARLSQNAPEFPFIALLVSGGHTQLILAKSLGNYELLGDTLDDAVGEAFDKTAKLLGISYPGGAKLAALADSSSHSDYLFPRPMTDRSGLDFSFSGLKTHALTTWINSTKDETAKAHVARAFQDAVIDTLLIKCKRAVTQSGCQKLVVAGGVGANLSLRQRLTDWMAQINGHVYFPPFQFCTDNGAMIAYAGFLHAMEGQKDMSDDILVKARWPL